MHVIDQKQDIKDWHIPFGASHEKKSFLNKEIAGLRKQTLWRSREAEKVYKITRFPSAHQLGKMAHVTTKQPLQSKSSAFWECVECLPNRTGGYIYKLQMREEFNTLKKDVYWDELSAVRDRIERKNEEIFPAEELDGLKMAKMLSRESKETKDILYSLGYKIAQLDGKAYLYLPDGDALGGLWEEVRVKHPTLPPLKIRSSKGVAGDIEFVESYLANEVLLSCDKEFVHDHQFHILPKIKTILSYVLEKGEPLSYAQEKKRLNQIVFPYYKKIQIVELLIEKAAEDNKPLTGEMGIVKKALPQIKATLGAAVDSLAAQKSTADLIRDAYLEYYFPIPMSAEWLSYFYRRFEKTKTKEQTAYMDLQIKAHFLINSIKGMGL